MKLTSREKALLGVLLALVILYIEYTYLLSGQFERINASSEVKKNLEIRLDMLNNAPKTETDLNGKIQQSMVAVNAVMDKYFVTTQQEELILLMNDLLTDSGVTAYGFVFGPPGEAALGDATFKTATITINFSATYENFEKLMKKIWGFQKMLVIDNISMSRDQSGMVSGNFDIVCYYLTGHEDTGYIDNLYQIIPDESFYKGNPFSPSAGANDFRINYLFMGGKEPGEVAYVPYDDIKGHWAEAIINDFGNQGYLPPTQSKTFGPDTPMTRGEFVIMLDRIYKWPMPEQTVDLKKFTDYASLGSYENSIAKAVFKGYMGGFVVGYTDNTLRPRDPMTYDEMEFIVRKLKEQPNFKWEQIATSLKAEKAIDSAGVADKKAAMSKAEAVYMMNIIK